MKKMIAFAVAAACSSSVLAQSAGNLYGEVAYSTVSVKDVSSNNIGTYKPTAARFTVGKVVDENVAVEGFVLQGMSGSSNTIKVNGVNANVDVKLKTSYGIAVRPFVKLSNDLELFGRLGWVRSEIEGTVSAYGRAVSDSSKSTNSLYGVGISYVINDALKATVDYTKLSTKEDTESSLVSVGLRFNF